MTYEPAVTKAWDELGKLSNSERHAVKLLNDTYEIDVANRRAYSASCNVPTKDYLTITLLHYLIGSLKNKFAPSGEWVSFKDIAGGEIYYSAFREGAINPLIRKYGAKVNELVSAAARFGGKKIDMGDAAIELATFPDIKVRIILWKGDDEFGPEAQILFDKNLTSIYTMEDIVVFLRFVTHNV